MTIDGFIAGSKGEMDWMTLPWTEDINKFVEELLKPVDCIILGRKLAEGFIPHWEAVANNPDNPEVDSGKQFTEIPKIVFSKTLSQSKWENTVLAKGNLTDEITILKKQQGGDIFAYGGATFVSALIKEKLIDELHLFINPAVIGKGYPIFREVTENQKYHLLNSVHFDCGIIVLTYKTL